MEIIAVADSVTVSTTQGLGFAKFLLHRHYCSSKNHLSVLCDAAYESSSATGVLSITAGISPVDAVAPPIVRSNLYRTVPRTLLQKKRRTRKRSLAGDSEDGEDDGFFGNGDDGAFGGGSGGGGGGSSGGRGWNFDRYGESNWEESSSSSYFDPAFDFFYEVLSWIVLSSCMHFAYKKVIRIVADGIGDPSREKAPMRLVTMY